MLALSKGDGSEFVTQTITVHIFQNLIEKILKLMNLTELEIVSTF